MFRFMNHHHQVHEDWLPFLNKEKDQEYFKELELKLVKEYENNQIFPSRDLSNDSVVPPLCEIVAVVFVFDNSRMD